MSEIRAIALPLLLAGAMGAGEARGQVFDVTSDWSDQANPNGAWTYAHGASALPHVDAWEPGAWMLAQPGWALSGTSTSRLPVWFRSNGTEAFGHDWVAGDVVIHSTDGANGIGSGDGALIWTSPGAGRISITGAVWMGRDLGRANTWTLLHNSTALSSGALASGDPYSRATPFNLATGSGGAAPLSDRPVNVGDTITLQIVRTTGFGDFVGVQLVMTLVPSACPADLASNGQFEPPFSPDGQLSGADFDAFILAFFTAITQAGHLLADLASNGQFQPPFTPDGQLSGADFDAFILLFFTGCA